MAGPSASELLNFRVDPELGGGKPAVVLDDSQLLRQIAQQQQYHAENQRQKYKDFMDRYNGAIQNLQDIDQLETAGADQQALKDRSAKLFQKIESDPRAFFGAGNLKAMTDLNKDISSLRKDAAESKLNRTYDEANRKFLEQNPDIDTPENRQKIEGFLKTPLGKRSPYLLETTAQFDPMALAKGIGEVSKESVTGSSLSDDKQFIQSQSGYRIDQDKYNKAAAAMYDLPTPSGKPLSAVVQQRFSQLSPAMQGHYDNDPKKWYLETMNALRPPDDIKKTDIKANPLYELGIKERGLMEREMYRRGTEEDVAILKEHLKSQPTANKAINFFLTFMPILREHYRQKISGATPIGGGKGLTEEL